VVVIDTSALLAVFFNEPEGKWVADRLAEHVTELRMSTVNLAETLIRVRDRQPQLYDQIEDELLSSGIRFVPPDVEQARIVAEARFRYPLNLGGLLRLCARHGRGLSNPRQGLGFPKSGQAATVSPRALRPLR
jgi:PIN domain nuclease of toxin-antitoxin system